MNVINLISPCHRNNEKKSSQSTFLNSTDVQAGSTSQGVSMIHVFSGEVRFVFGDTFDMNENGEINEKASDDFFEKQMKYFLKKGPSDST